ncbi:iron-containing alcohol dehydrogenase [Spirillospora sp. NPDC048819]|uniref:iron-containing alcohol dehydrogenase n=1 Tax=Spirillospora sp. NPDC048819 TaxID=3155268 RepID=UPI0033E91DE1
MSDFVVLRSPSQVFFGRGMAEAVGRLAAPFGQRAFIVTDPAIAATPGFGRILKSLTAAGLVAQVFDAAAPDVPTGTVADALAAVTAARPDVVVAVGGGSSIDLAKVTALLMSHPGPLGAYHGEQQVPGPVTPLIALPTTAGTGSEATPVSVVSDADLGMKVGVSSPYLIPRIAICDPLLTVACPPAVTAHAGIDALVHAVESHMAAAHLVAEGPETVRLPLERVAIGKNPLSDLLALEAIRRIGAHLETAVRDGENLEARENMLYGSMLAGLAFGNSGVAAAHALQFAIGAATNTPHGLGTGLMLPYVMAFNRPVREESLTSIARALGGTTPDHAVTRLQELGRRIGLPGTLAELGLTAADLPRLAERAAGVRRLAANNPRKLDAAACHTILTAALTGDLSALRPAAAS